MLNKFSNNKTDAEITNEDPIEIENSNFAFSISKNVKKVFISKIIDSAIILNIEREVIIIILNNNGSSKNNVEINLLNKQAKATVREISLTENNEEFKNEISITHKNKETFSDYKFFGFAKDESVLSVAAKSIIPKGNSGSEAKQMIKIISDGDAIVDGQPGLLIDEYDVKASHGNSIGQVNDRDLYYLQSKGISKTYARWMIIEGSIKETLKSMEPIELEKILCGIKKSLVSEDLNV